MTGLFRLLDPGFGSGGRAWRDGLARIGRLTARLPRLTEHTRALTGLADIRAGWVRADRKGRMRLLLAGTCALACLLPALAALFLLLAGWAIGSAAAQNTANVDALFADPTVTVRFLEWAYRMGSGTAIAGLFVWWNLAGLFVAGIVILGVFGQGLLEAAQSGRVGITGVQILRMVVVIALMIPLAGFCVVQHGVVKVAELGGAAASTIWREIGHGMFLAGQTTVPVHVTPAQRRLVASLIPVAVCREGVRVEARQAGTPHDAQDGVQRFPDGRVAELTFGSRTFPTGCGRISFAPVRSGVGSHRAEQIFDAHEDAVELIMSRILVDAARHADALVGADEALRDAAVEQLRRTVQGGGYASLYATRLTAALQAAADGAQGAREQRMRRIDEHGWIGAPLVWNVVAADVAGVLEASRAVPGIDGPENAFLGVWTQTAEAVALVQETIAEAGSGLGDRTALSFEGGNWFDAFLREIWPAGSWIEIDPQNPIEDLARLGGTLMASAITALATLAAAAASAEFLEKLPIIGNLAAPATGMWSVIEAPAMMVVMALLLAGIVLAFIVPMLPFIRFLFALGTWVLEIVEALLAAPLWLIAFLSPDRGSLVPQTAREGALLLLGLALRPALMIAGLVIGFIVTTVLIAVLNTGFAAAATNASSQAGGALVQVVYTVIYVILAYLIVNLSFGAIDRFPSTVLRWIGARIDRDHDTARGALIAGLGRTERMGPNLRAARGRPAGTPVPRDD